jgi:glycosyltransferase involved in cell wall biosynthesis
MEAHTVTGPAKNLIRFAKLAGARSNGAQLSLITYLRANGPKTNRFIEAVQSAGIPISIIEERSAFDRSIIGKLREVLRVQKPDIVQTHAVKSHFLNGFARPSGLPWLAYHHGYTDPDLKMQMYNTLDRWSLPRADRVVTVCKPFAEMLAKKGVKRSKIRVLGNSIEPITKPLAATREQIRSQWNIPDQAALILTIGRLSAEKGHRDLLSALKVLRDRQPDLPLRVLLLGDGPERQRLEQQSAALGFSEVLVFAGHQQDPLPYYRAADLFVLPSLSEGSPNVLLEAMMAQTPIISTAVGGVPEMAQNERSALLIKSADSAALADAMHRLLNDSVLANTLRQNAYQDVLQNHTPEAYCSSLVGIYSDLLKKT